MKIDYNAYWPKMHDDLVALVDTPYRYGAEAFTYDWPPKELDCSEFVELIYARRGIPCPDGAHNQWLASYPVEAIRPGDLGFWLDHAKARPGRYGIYHVGIWYGENTVIEARAKDSKGRYGKVIFRPRQNWETWGPFKLAGGWRRLKVLKNT